MDVEEVLLNDFYDFHNKLNEYYRTLEQGKTTWTHVFSILNKKFGRKLTMLYKQDDTETVAM